MTRPATRERLLVSKVEAAELLGVSLDSFERWVMDDLRVVAIGRRRLFSIEDLNRWIERHAATPLGADLDRMRQGSRR